MNKRLRVPAVLVVAVVGGASVVGLLSSASCHDDAKTCGPNELLCVPTPDDGGNNCYRLADAGNCPIGCEPICESMG